MSMEFIYKMIVPSMLLLTILAAQYASSATYNYAPCGENRVCAPSALCIDQKIDTHGSNFFNPKANDVYAECGVLEECCMLPDKHTTTTTTTTSTTTTTTTTTTIKPEPEPIATTTMSSTSVITTTASATPTLAANFIACGYSTPDNNVDFDPRISDGESSVFGEFPWMVAFLTLDFSEDIAVKYSFAGFLIAPNAVITAAHRVRGFSPTDFHVRAGHTAINEADTNEQDILVKEIIVHEQFNAEKSKLHNDIAIVLLEKSFELKESIQPICLPPPNLNFENMRCLIAGWSRRNVQQKDAKLEPLKKIEVPMVSRVRCQRELRATRLSDQFVLHDSHICAGGEQGRDACIGDGGAPLMCGIRGTTNRYYAAGAVVASVGCGKKDVPGIYANMALHNRWIRQKLNERNIDLRYSTA